MTRMKGLYRVIALLLCLMLLMGVCCTASAQSVKRVQTGKYGASLRALPQQDSTKLASIHSNVYLDVYETQGRWYRVYFEGEYGWVHAGVVSVAEWGADDDTWPDGSNDDNWGDSQTSGGVARVITGKDGASLRRYPQLDSEKLASIHRNVYLDVYETQGDWYHVKYDGEYGWVHAGKVSIVEWGGSTGTDITDGNDDDGSWTSSGNDAYDMGIPFLNGAVCTSGDMNMVVFWVQTQLKATNIWYQGEIWDVTGNLGDHTMQEISAFMQSRGYPGHSGIVDQQVVDELADYLGSRIQPVYVGGFYEGMDSIMSGGHTGSMYAIVSNLRDGNAWVTNEARWVQTVLKGVGYYNGAIDGKFGEQTEAAVKKFQKNHHFQERDYVSLGVARKMLEEYYARGNSISMLP